MLTPRRLILIVSAVAVFIFILSSISHSSSTDDLKQEVENTLGRSYPPPQSPKKPKDNQQSVSDISSKPLRDRLRYYFPYDLDTKFPAYIWQTWKTNPSSGAFEEGLRGKEASWTEKHPGFVHEVIVDEAAEHLVRYLYASVPEVAEAYHAMPLPVLKADFFRYLILLARGGIYTDIDTDVIKPAMEWLPEGFPATSVGLVVGIEADPDRPDWHEWYARRIQFCQWTIQAKPGHPVLREIVATITEDTLQMKKKGELRRGKKPNKSVMEFTGPGVWTDSIMNYFNDKEYFDFSTRKTNISASEFFAMTERKLLGDVMILPITSFSPGVGQMGAGDLEDPLAFVHHEFSGK